MNIGNLKILSINFSCKKGVKQHIVPQIFVKNGINYIKQHKKRGIFFCFVFILMLCLLIFSVADVISSVITSSKSIFLQNKIEVASYNVYAVSVCEVSSEEEAKLTSNKTKSLGGAGLIYESGKFYILTSMYPTLAQAKEIQSNLISRGNDSKIITLEIDYISKKYSGKNLKEVVNYIKAYKTIYKNLFEISINFDKEKLSIQQAKNNITELLNIVLKNGLEVKKHLEDSQVKNLLVNSYNSEKNFFI